MHLLLVVRSSLFEIIKREQTNEVHFAEESAVPALVLNYAQETMKQQHKKHTGIKRQRAIGESSSGDKH